MKIPVLVPNIFDHPFTYETDMELKLGEYVLVPFGKSKMTGVVWDHFEKTQKKNFLIKKIFKKLKVQPLNKKTIKFMNWFSEYNLIPKGMSLKLHLLSSEALENFQKKEYEFYNKLVNVVLPQLRDFRGISPNSFDGRGNYSLGLQEQVIFPEISYDKISEVRGLNISIVTTATTDEEGRELLKLMGMPFRD